MVDGKETTAKGLLGRRYSKEEVNLAIVFLNEGVPEILRVNLFLTSLTIQRFRMPGIYYRNFKFILAPNKVLKIYFQRF